jgi:hypothetical protein
MSVMAKKRLIACRESHRNAEEAWKRRGTLRASFSFKRSRRFQYQDDDRRMIGTVVYLLGVLTPWQCMGFKDPARLKKSAFFIVMMTLPFLFRRWSHVILGLDLSQCQVNHVERLFLIP